MADVETEDAFVVEAVDVLTVEELEVFVVVVALLVVY